MKHKNKSALPCDLKRQHLRDRLHRQAKPEHIFNHTHTATRSPDLSAIKEFYSVLSTQSWALIIPHCSSLFRLTEKSKIPVPRLRRLTPRGPYGE